MIVWCVNTTNCEHFHGVYGVYSNLAIAGNAAMQCFRNMQDIKKIFYENDSYLTCYCVSKSWGYAISMYENDVKTGEATFFGTIEIGKMYLNE